jgi:hypothetical protein
MGCSLNGSQALADPVPRDAHGDRQIERAGTLGTLVELAARMRAQGLTWAEIATAFRVRYGVNAARPPHLRAHWLLLQWLPGDVGWVAAGQQPAADCGHDGQANQYQQEVDGRDAAEYGRRAALRPGQGGDGGGRGAK